MRSNFRNRLLGATEQTSFPREILLLAIAALFVLINAIALSLVAEGQLDWSHLYPVIVWIGVFSTILLVLHRFRPHHDPFLLPIIALLSGWGLVILDRLVPAFLYKQTIWLVLAGCALLLAALLPSSLSFFRRYRYLWLLLGLMLLAATLLFGVNPSGYGAELWLKVPLAGRVYFQPSELLKIIMIVFLAGYFDEQEQLHIYGLSRFRFGSLRNIAPLLAMWCFSLILLVWQRDLGAAALFLIVFLTLLYLATGNWRYVLGGLALLFVASIVAYLVYDVVATRFNTWLNPWPSAREQGYQIVQSLYALASGGVIGQGVGQGFPTYVPVAHTDFTYAAVAEEWGLIGGLIAVISFALISYRGFKIAAQSTNSFRLFIAAGISVVLGVQSLLILGGITRLLPLTGVTLPFISYGGSSLLMSFLMVGFLLNLSSSQRGIPRSGDGEFSMHPTGNVPSLEARTRLRHLAMVTVIAFASVFLMVVYWTALRGTTLLSRDDNPRLVEQERRIQRGSIFDSGGEILAETVDDPEGTLQRSYHPYSGPSVGYYSFEHGTAGIENAFDEILRGGEDDAWNAFVNQNLLHNQQEGQDVRLTIDSSWQQLAYQTLDGNTGAIVLLSLPDNAIRASVSYPTYDANSLDDQFEEMAGDESGPLLNRVVQGQYQPGLTIQPFVLATAVDLGIIEFEGQDVEPARTVTINGTELDCALETPAPKSWADVLTQRCPGSMASLAAKLDLEGLYSIYDSYGLTALPELGIGERTDEQYEIDDLEMALLGQDNLSVSPLQVALALSTLGNRGLFTPPMLVQSIQDENGAWRPQLTSGIDQRILSEEVAMQTLEAMSVVDGVIEHSVVVLSGPFGSSNSWYLGLAPAGNPRYALVVILENNSETAAAEEIGRAVLKAVLSGENG
jgi:cell division protein FtsW (lipid II flippase)/cell division protein FtsI/penicillin-binding protein 2